MRMGIGLGVGINRSNYAQGIFGAYATRVVADGGVVEAGTCVDAVSGILLNASLLLIPSGYKGGKLYAEIPTNGNGDLTWTRGGTANRTNASGNIELMGANVPRLSYMYGSCPAVLLEPQRTNLLLQSNTFNTTWAMFTGPAVTPNSTTSPDGSTNATTLNSSGGTNDFLFQTLSGLTIGTTYTFSFYIKNLNSSASRAWGPTASTSIADMSWSGSTLVSISGSGNSFTSVGNGWYRVVLTGAAATATPSMRIYADVNNTSKSVYIFGAQLEAGAYPTTYIPTTSATATRVADSFSRNNIYTNGLITSSGGTWFVHFRVQSNAQRDNSNSLKIGDANNGFNIVGSTSGYGFIVGKVVSSTYSNILFSNLGASAFVKLAIKWNGTTADIFANGTKVVSATSFTATDLPNLSGSFGSALFIQQMALFPTPLSDTDCTTITTL